MKKLILSSIIITLSMISFSQVDDEYQKFLNETNSGLQKMRQEQVDYIAKRNAEFADFVAKEWKLFEDFKTEQLAMTLPKPKEIPTAKPDTTANVDMRCEVECTVVQELPAVTNTTSIAEKVSSLIDNYIVRRRIGSNESNIVVINLEDEQTQVTTDPVLNINFYGCALDIPFNDNLRVKPTGYKEKDVAQYINDISKHDDDAKALWGKLSSTVNDLGLNEWGYYCLLRSIADKVFEDNNDKVLFCFYMLRNEGNFKTKVARGKDSGELLLLLAIDNSLDVYSYPFFRLTEQNNNKVKYYTVFGGNGKESIYTYNFCEQDAEKKQMSLDFYKNLNMGKCDVIRTLNITKNEKVMLPYNSSHIAYLNDVPMTMFPIYFASPISIEAQKVLSKEFSKLSAEYSPYQFIGILLNFVQNAFDYKTDDEQFGYEKYFYPEEVLGYPYSDCEDRAALFSWLVTTYTNAKVIGLQYEGHVATAVCFGDDVNIKGDSFSYGGKRYYVCDPTYINASVGMTMPQFEGVTPKVIKLRSSR